MFNTIKTVFDHILYYKSYVIRITVSFLGQQFQSTKVPKNLAVIQDLAETEKQ